MRRPTDRSVRLWDGGAIVGDGSTPKRQIEVAGLQAGVAGGQETSHFPVPGTGSPGPSENSVWKMVSLACCCMNNGMFWKDLRNKGQSRHGQCACPCLLRHRQNRCAG